MVPWSDCNAEKLTCPTVDLIITFEKNVAALRGVSGSGVDYDSQFALKFDLLQHKAGLVRLGEAYNISCYLSTLTGDSSFQTLVLEEGLRSMTVKDGQKHIGELYDLVVSCEQRDLPVLAEEMDRVRTQFAELAMKAMGYLV